MEPTAKLLHRTRVAVRWADMDALGHVNHAQYLRFFEQSRIEWFATLGWRVDGRGEGPVLLKSTVTWLRPVVYPSELEVRVLAGRVGNTSFHLGGEIVNAHDAAERFTEAEFVMVWSDYASARPVRVPDRIRELVGAAA